MGKDTLWRVLGIGTTLIQWGCIAHCTFECIGEPVIVSIQLMN